MSESETPVEIVPVDEPDDEELQSMFAAALASVTGRYDESVGVPPARPAADPEKL
jgi:hypothetical protein